MNKNYVKMSRKNEEYLQLSQKEFVSTVEKDENVNEINNLDCPGTSIKCPKVREKWGKEIEFLLSCITLSVGLGNVWRFPFIALNNGGGAFLIPYVIVLLIIGRPVYYMEVIIGQFSSKGCIKAFDFAPIMRGVAYGQVYATAIATTYYACIMGLTIRYLIASISNILPWSICKEEWKNCLNSTRDSLEYINSSDSIGKSSSSELYFIKEVLREKDNLNEGLGIPNLDLVLCLAVAWCIIAGILVKGIRSSGKASYFLATFPYIIMIILLVRAVTLPGSLNGIIYFIKPQWEQLLNPRVWYNAITQVFFSLAICFGTLIMYASYNQINRKVYNDILIVTTCDSITSTLAGCIIFGILGNLAHETGKDLASVVKGGAGLAFISYPDAISKFEFMPQVFAVLFFSMLLVLGIGSNIGMTSCVITVIRDQFNNIPHWILAILISVLGFLLGIIYMTPGGQFILNLMDFYGASFIALILAIAELIAVGWIYGVRRFCNDIEFMFGIKTGIYWRVCWAFITPALMISVLIYTLIEYEPLTYRNIPYPSAYYTAGWIIWAIGVLQLPLWALYEIWKQPQDGFYKKLKSACKPSALWGPLDYHVLSDYNKFRTEINQNTLYNQNVWQRFYDNIFG